MPVRCALARLELDEEALAVQGQLAQLVDLGVAAGADQLARRAA